MTTWVFPVPGGPRKTTVSRAATESRAPRGPVRSRFKPRGWSKSNSSRLFRAARIRPSPPWSSRADLSLRADDRELLMVHDSARARSINRGTASRKVGTLSARVRNGCSCQVAWCSAVNTNKDAVGLAEDGYF
jgi:hypothetical protein